MNNANETKRIELQHKQEILLNLKTLFESDKVYQKQWDTLYKKAEQYGITYADLFHNFKYGQQAQQAIVGAINKGFEREAIIIKPTHEPTYGLVYMVLCNKEKYGLNMVTLIDYELTGIEAALGSRPKVVAPIQVSEMPLDTVTVEDVNSDEEDDTYVAPEGKPSSDIDMQNVDLNPTGTVTTDLGLKKTEATDEALPNTPSICCSATALITLGGALITVSALVHQNHSSVAFLIALHAPHAVLIAASAAGLVVGAAMLVCGAYLALRMLSAAKATEEVEYEKVNVESETLSEEGSVDTKQQSYVSCFGFSSLFSCGAKEEDSDDEDDEENQQSSGCSMSRYFSSCFTG